MYAIIKTQGKQYRVAANDVITIDRMEGEAGDVVTISQVLLVGGEAGIQVGAPFVEGVSVQAEIVAQARGPKVIAFKKRRRKNSRRARGFRADLTKLKIVSIGAGEAPKAKAKKAKAEDAADAAA